MKVKVYFGKRLADCCGNKNVVTSSLSVVAKARRLYPRTGGQPMV